MTEYFVEIFSTFDVRKKKSFYIAKIYNYSQLFNCSSKLNETLMFGKWLKKFMKIFRKMVICYQNCSSDWEKRLKLEAEGREFANFLRSLEQFIQTVKGQKIFWKKNAFLTCSWRFLRYNKLEQSELKLEKIIGI